MKSEVINAYIRRNHTQRYSNALVDATYLIILTFSFESLQESSHTWTLPNHQPVLMLILMYKVSVIIQIQVKSAANSSRGNLHSHRDIILWIRLCGVHTRWDITISITAQYVHSGHSPCDLPGYYGIVFIERNLYGVLINHWTRWCKQFKQRPFNVQNITRRMQTIYTIITHET